MREGRDTAEDSTDERRDCVLECMKMRDGSSICSCWLGVV